MEYSIGIDPGKSGSIVVLDSKRNITICNIQTVGKEIDIRHLALFLKSFSENSFCVIEDVHSIHGSSSKSNFQFGRALGIVEGIIAAYHIPFVKVAPKKWQEKMWQGVQPVLINTGKRTTKGNIKFKVDTKATSQIAAKRLFPTVDFRPTERSKNDHDGAIDASLLALYCQQNYV